MQIQNKMMFSGSADQTGRSWVLEFGTNTRVFQGHEHTVTCVRFYDGMGEQMFWTSFVIQGGAPIVTLNKNFSNIR